MKIVCISLDAYPASVSISTLYALTFKMQRKWRNSMKQRSRVCVCVCVFVRMHMYWKNSSAYQVVLSSGVVWWNAPCHSKTPEEMFDAFKSCRFWLPTMWTHCCISENQWHPKSAVFFWVNLSFLKDKSVPYSAPPSNSLGSKTVSIPGFILGLEAPRGFGGFKHPGWPKAAKT